MKTLQRIAKALEDIAFFLGEIYQLMHQRI